jgi:zinc transport system permease protein
LLFGNVLAIQTSHLIALLIEAAVVALLQLLLWRRFLLVTFDAEAARVAGVKTRWWSLAINLLIGGIAAGAVHEIGALSTFALLTLPAMAALLATSSIRATFIVAAALGVLVPSLALAASYYFDLPAGPACAAFLALTVAVAAIRAAFTEIHQPISRLERGAEARTLSSDSRVAG